MVNVFTVDVEDYYHAHVFADIIRRDERDRFDRRVVENTRQLMDILEEAGARATFFVLGCIAAESPELVAEIAGRGHEVACHSYAHDPVVAMTPEEFAADVTSAKSAIEAAAGRRVAGFRAPSYSIPSLDHWAFTELSRAGFSYDSSIFPTKFHSNGLDGAPRFPFRLESGLMEFPMSTLRMFGRNLPVGAGAFLRLLPFALTTRALGAVNSKDGQPFVLMIHSWEIDPEQPVMPVGPVRRWRHYHNLGKMTGRLKTLLQRYRFAPMREVLGLAAPVP